MACDGLFRRHRKTVEWPTEGPARVPRRTPFRRMGGRPRGGAPAPNRVSGGPPSGSVSMIAHTPRYFSWGVMLNEPR
jgi:hypothetical protein